MNNPDAIQLQAKFFRGFADPTRLAVLRVLLGGEKNVNEIVELVGISQPNASAHLACLRECGLVTGEGRGKFTYYRIADEKINKLLEIAEELVAQTARGIYACLHYETPKARNLANPKPHLPLPSIQGRSKIKKAKIKTVA